MKRTINDCVDDIHLKLSGDPRYRALLSATCNEQAVEGRLEVDDTLAADMIQKFAKLNHHVEVANANLRTIRKALQVVLRRTA
jgi:hypothetical protein